MSSATDHVRERVALVSEVTPSPGAPPASSLPWARCRDDIDEIISRADEPWVPLKLGEHTIATVRSGATGVVVGPTGRGKTSLALSLSIDHALYRGTAIVASLELPPDEITARVIGTRLDAGWADALRARDKDGCPLSRETMIDAVPERLWRIPRERATLEAIDRTVEAAQREHAGEPVLVVADYVQILALAEAEAAAHDNAMRMSVGRVMRGLDAIARSRRRCVILALSQGSRISSRALSSGGAVGVDTVDSGAESSDLERWASVVLTIGQLDAEGEDGFAPAKLSIAKARMGRGDRVLGARYNGRTGQWQLTGEEWSGSEVRAERAAARAAKTNKVAIAADRVVDLVAAELARSDKPLSQNDLEKAIGGNADDVRTAVKACIRDGRAVLVNKKSGGHWLKWTRERATAAGVSIVSAEAER